MKDYLKRLIITLLLLYYTMNQNFYGYGFGFFANNSNNITTTTEIRLESKQQHLYDDDSFKNNHPNNKKKPYYGKGKHKKNQLNYPIYQGHQNQIVKQTNIPSSKIQNGYQNNKLSSQNKEWDQKQKTTFERSVRIQPDGTIVYTDTLKVYF